MACGLQPTRRTPPCNGDVFPRRAFPARFVPMHTATRTHGFTESVIRGMTRLANEHGAINLAQGFPNFSAPDPLKDAAARAIRDDINQYAITWGAKRLRDALARKYADWYGMTVDPETE